MRSTSRFKARDEGKGMKSGLQRRVNQFVLFSVSHGIWVIFLIIFLIGAIFVQGFFKAENFVNVVWGNVSFGFLVLGMFLVLLTGNMDLSIESTFGIAAILGARFMVTWLPGVVTPVVAVVIVLAVGCLVGLVNAFFCIKLNINSFLVTLTMLLVLRGLCQFIIPEGLYYLPDGFNAIGNSKMFGVFPTALVLFIVAAFVVWVLTKKTAFGKNLYAIGSSEKAAYLDGIDIKRLKTITLIISGLAAALGGLVSAGRMQAVVADMGSGQVMMVFAACFLGGTAMSGGKGEVVDLIGATLTLCLITNILNLLGVNPYLINVIYGLVLLFAIVFANAQQGIRQRMLLKSSMEID